MEDIVYQAQKDPAAISSRIEETVQDLNQVIRDIRSYIMDLRPRELQGRSPDEALETLIKYLEDRTGATVELESGVDLGGLSERYMVNLWHIFQEAFSNIEKYAGAGKVSVTLAVYGGNLNLEIADDGEGFDPEKAEMGKGYGLSNIKDRAERLGGILVMHSAPGQGARLEIKVPMDTQGPLSRGAARRENGG